MRSCHQPDLVFFPPPNWSLNSTNCAASGVTGVCVITLEYKTRLHTSDGGVLMAAEEPELSAKWRRSLCKILTTDASIRLFRHASGSKQQNYFLGKKDKVITAT